MIIKIPLKADPPSVTAQQKGEKIAVKYVGGRRVQYIQHFEKDEVTRVRNLYRVEILRAVKASGQKLPRFDGPVWMRVVFLYKARRKKDIGQPKPTKPDADNMNKLWQDVLGDDLGLFTVGDQQISHIEVEKLYAPAPGIYMEIKPHITTPEELNDIFTI